jgi:hypothetical protein
MRPLMCPTVLFYYVKRETILLVNSRVLELNGLKWQAVNSSVGYYLLAITSNPKLGNYLPETIQ